jgi:hypothetical protein
MKISPTHHKTKDGFVKRNPRKWNLRSLNKLVKDKERTEITRFRGKYHVLHICKNNVPVPLYIAKDAGEIAKEIKLHGY